VARHKRIPTHCRSRAGVPRSPPSECAIGRISCESVLLQLALEGRVTPLAVTSTTRWPELPDIPTMAESGIAEVPTDISYSVYAPANTPAAIINRLNSAINEGMTSPE
jgi:tripartite-type tricarboxylate transporter receptor subunit TctC